MRNAQEPAVGVDVVGQGVHAALFEIAPLGHLRDTEDDGVAAKRRHFHPGQQDEAESIRGCFGFVESAEGVVIGQRDRVVARRVAGLEHRRDAVLPVAVQRVQVRFDLEHLVSASGKRIRAYHHPRW